MPARLKDYPAHWRDVRATVLARAGNRCEYRSPAGVRCTAEHHAVGVWLDEDACFEEWHQGVHRQAQADTLIAGHVRDDNRRPVWIILTTAHLCACQPLCGDPAHLRAYCQRHHNRYDAPMRARNAAATRRARQLAATGQLELPT